MLRRIVQHLLAPTETDGGGATATADGSSPDFLGAFLTEEPAEAAAPASATKKEDKPDGTKTDPGNGAGAGPVVPAAAAAAPKPEADKAAADVAKAKEGAAADADEDGKFPKNSEDWDRFRSKHKGREEKLKGELAARDTQLADLQRQLEAAKVKPAEDTATNAEIERRDALIKNLTERIAVLDVTKDPRFEQYFDAKLTQQNQMADNIVGAERKDDWKRIMALPDGEYRREQIEEFMGGLTPYQQSRLGGVINALDGIEQERKTEIEKAGKHRETLMAQRESKQKDFAAQRQKGFDEALAALQDPKAGNPVFQSREGDEAWNAALAKSVDTAKSLLFGNQIAPREIAKAALFASAFPKVVASYNADMQAKNETITKLEAQVKALTAAQPGGGGSGEKAAGAAEPRSTIKASMNPFEVAEAFAADLTAHANR